MSRREIIQCDRCPATGDADSLADRSSWGRVYAATVSCVDRVGTSTTPADLCGECMHDLVMFIGGSELASTEAKRSKAK